MSPSGIVAIVPGSLTAPTPTWLGLGSETNYQEHYIQLNLLNLESS